MEREAVTRLYVAQVCPDCGGQGQGGAWWHDGECPNRDKIFAARELFTVPVAERDRLREALAFYAAPATYEEGAPSPGFLDGEVPVERDRGLIARSALSPVSNPGAMSETREQPKVSGIRRLSSGYWTATVEAWEGDRIVFSQTESNFHDEQEANDWADFMVAFLTSEDGASNPTQGEEG